MKAVILCGGLGTRIRDVNESMPKPMLPIGKRPIVWHIMKIYASHGIKDFVLCLGYKSWLFKEWFLNYRTMTSDITLNLGNHGALQFHSGHEEEDWSVTLAETGEYTMTGGRVAAVKKYVEDEDIILVTYGDGVSDIDVSALVEYHRSHGKIATVTAVRPPSRFGEMDIRDNDCVRAFMEKPQVSQGEINGGFFVFDAKRIWSYLPAEPTLILEREPLQRLAHDGELMAYHHEGFWQPMDTSREFRILNEMWEKGEAQWKTW